MKSTGPGVSLSGVMGALTLIFVSGDVIAAGKKASDSDSGKDI